MVLLVADMEELKADYNVPAEGLVIESNLEKGRGAVVRLLVENGTLTKVISLWLVQPGVKFAPWRTGKAKLLRVLAHQRLPL